MVVSARCLSLRLALLVALFPASARADWPALGEVYSKARQHAIAVTEAVGNIKVAQASAVGARVSSLMNPYLQFIADRGKATVDVQFQGQLFFPVDLAPFEKIEPDDQMCVGAALSVLFPPRLVVVKTDEGGWEVID